MAATRHAWLSPSTSLFILLYLPLLSLRSFNPILQIYCLNFFSSTDPGSATQKEFLLPQLNAWVQCLLSAPIMKSWRGTIDWPSLSFHPSIYQAQYLKPQSQFIQNDDACNCLILPLKRHRLKGLMHYLFAHVPVMQTSDITYENWKSPRFWGKWHHMLYSCFEIPGLHHRSKKVTYSIYL